jgi:hypothetical protein
MDITALGAELLAQYKLDNPYETIDDEDFLAGFGLGVNRGSETVVNPDAWRDRNADPDTRSKGTGGPFATWESDGTGMVHALWSAHNNGLTLEANADEIKSRIMGSRWLAAVRAEAGRTFTTLAEVEAAPEGTIICDALGARYERCYPTAYGPWATFNTRGRVQSAQITLPARFL